MFIMNDYHLTLEIYYQLRNHYCLGIQEMGVDTWRRTITSWCKSHS